MEGAWGNYAMSYLYPVCYNSKWGYMDRGGDIVVDPLYRDTGVFNEGFGYAETDEGRLIVFNEQGDEISSIARLCGDQYFSEGYLPVRRGNLCGYIDEHCNVIVEPKFDIAFPFVCGMGLVRQSNKLGLISTTGEWVHPPEYQQIERFHESENTTIGISQDEEHFFLTADGKTQRLLNVAEARQIRQGLCPVKCTLDERWGWINLNNECLVSNKFSDIGGSFGADMLIAVKHDNNWGLSDVNGRFLPVEGATWIGEESEGLRPFSVGSITDEEMVRGGLFGYVDSIGRIAVEPRFAFAVEFRGGLGEAFYDHDGKSELCYVDKDDTVVWREK